MRIFLLICFAQAAWATGFLSLESSPTGAEVWYTGPEDPDKKYLGDTPLENRELPTGRYNFWLILPGHDTLAIPDVYIAEGQVTQINREIPTHYGYLEVTTDPDSAVLFLEEANIGNAPHVNSLVLPGVYALKAMPREAHYKNSTRKITMNKGDTLRLAVEAPHRDKSFFRQNLSLPPLRLQIEAGIQYRSIGGDYDTAGKKLNRPNDSIGRQWDIPLRARVGLPAGFELHMLLPFKSYGNADSLAPFRSNMRFGVKYTYRPLNVGLDASYGFGIRESLEAFNHDLLALTAIGMASKDKITGEANLGFEFHFADKNDNRKDPPDVAVAHAQVGYLLDPLLPYLAADASFRLDGDDNGTPIKGGYVLAPEVGLIIDVADKFSLQFGVPFSIVGKNGSSYWGLHASFSAGFSIK